MRLSELKALSREESQEGYARGNLTRFSFMFRDYLNGEKAWPVYQPADIAALRERLNLTQEALAVLLQVSAKTVMRWESAEDLVPGTAQTALCTLDKLGDGIFDLMDTKYTQFKLMVTSGEEQNLTKDTEDAAYNLSASRRQSAPPENFDKAALTAVRERLNVSRREFAQLLGVSPSTTDKWESGSVIPKGPALRLLQILWMHGSKPLTP